MYRHGDVIYFSELGESCFENNTYCNSQHIYFTEETDTKICLLGIDRDAKGEGEAEGRG